MNSVRPSLRLVLGAAVAAAALAPTAAQAATTIGPNPLVQGTDNINACGMGGCTFAATSGTGLTAVAPADGVIVRWRIRANAGSFKLRILRTAGAQVAAERTSAPGVATGGTGPDVFPTRLSIRAGEAIGADNASSALAFTPVGGESVAYWAPPLADLAAPRPPSTTISNLRLQLNADIEPDADRDGFGDETQDGCPANPVRQGPPCTSTTPGGTPVDTVRPAFSFLRGFSVRGARFGIGRRLSAVFRLSEKARVTATLYRLLPGRISGGRCRTTARTGRRCTLAFRRSALVRSLTAGPRSVTFGARFLPAGRYQIRLSARDAAGNTSLLRSVTILLAARR